jgi:hypothetical protein
MVKLECADVAAYPQIMQCPPASSTRIRFAFLRLLLTASLWHSLQRYPPSGLRKNSDAP